MKNHLKGLILVLIGVVGITIAIAFLPKNIKSEYDKYDLEKFTACLNEKGATIYGSYSCAYCQKQKKEFGASWKNLNYVECTKDAQKCIDANVQGTPTWTFSDGSRVEGYLPLPDFANKVGCPLELKSL